MLENEKETGVLLALLKRMEDQRLPRVLAIKEKVDGGARLEDFDITFLKEIFHDAEKAKPLIDKHPEYHELASRVISLYHDITSQALENEKNK